MSSLFSRRIRNAVTLLIASLVLTACNENPEDEVRDQARDDLRCPDNEIEVRQISGVEGDASLGPLVYQAQGCGRTASYACYPESTGQGTWSHTTYRCCEMNACVGFH